MMGLSWNDFISNPGLFIQGLPYSLGLIFILGAHEFSHYFTATYYKIATSLPHFIPAPWMLNSKRSLSRVLWEHLFRCAPRFLIAKLYLILLLLDLWLVW